MQFFLPKQVNTRLPLNTLPAFRTVARLGNLREAADTLHLTHSAVSQQIRLLETRLGFALFDRVGRGMVLNVAGQTLLRAVGAALDEIDDGVRSARQSAAGGPVHVRLTLLPSFAQRWLLPRMARWRAREPDIALDLNTSQDLVDLQRDGFHAGIRQGGGAWKGLSADPLIDPAMVAVGSPQAAARLDGQPHRALAAEPLLGNVDRWNRWFAGAGVATRVRPVATFNDAGLMLQAVEQDIGVALVREVLAADALYDGRVVRLSPHELPGEPNDGFWLVYPPALAHWPPLAALRAWITEELAQSRARLAPPARYPLRDHGAPPATGRPGRR